MDEYINKKVILKMIIRSPAGALIGTKEQAGYITNIQDTISIKTYNEIIEIPTEEAYISNAEHESYVIGGTGPFETPESIREENIDYIVEWDTVQDLYVPKEKKKTYKEKSIISKLKKEADVFGMAECPRLIKIQENEKYRELIPSKYVYQIIQFEFE